MNNPSTHAPIGRESRGLRPLYDVPDDRLDVFRTDTEVWRRAVRLDPPAALLESLAGLDVGVYEQEVVAWLARVDTPTVAVVALLHRARAAAPLAV